MSKSQAVKEVKLNLKLQEESRLSINNLCIYLESPAAGVDWSDLSSRHDTWTSAAESVLFHIEVCSYWVWWSTNVLQAELLAWCGVFTLLLLLVHSPSRDLQLLWTFTAQSGRTAGQGHRVSDDGTQETDDEVKAGIMISTSNSTDLRKSCCCCQWSPCVLWCFLGSEASTQLWTDCIFTVWGTDTNQQLFWKGQTHCEGAEVLPPCSTQLEEKEGNNPIGQSCYMLYKVGEPRSGPDKQIKMFLCKMLMWAKPGGCGPRCKTHSRPDMHTQTDTGAGSA